jgi:hypothetical protein
VQKKDRDRRDNAQRDENEERDPHANCNAVGNRVTTRWHSHESREPFVQFHGFHSPGATRSEEGRDTLLCNHAKVISKRLPPRFARDRKLSMSDLAIIRSMTP